MQQVSRRLPPGAPPDTGRLVLAIVAIGLLMLAVSAYYLNAFRGQRQQTEYNTALLRSYQAQLLTATPAAQERARLQQQLSAAQQRFAEASGLLPGGDVEVAVLQRIAEAAERSGVALSNLAQQGEPVQEGALVGWQYDVAATGDLQRLTDFAERLEQEAFPAAFFADPLVSEGEDGQYVLAGTLTVYGSTLSTGPLAAQTPIAPDPAQLRVAAAEAQARGDWEQALSLLLRLKALEPDAGDVDGLLYDAYTGYAQALLAQGLLDLAEEQAEAALALNPDGPEAVSILLAVAQRRTPTPGTAIALGSTPTATQSGGPPPFATPTTGQPPTQAVPPTQPVQPTQPLPPTIAPPPAPPTRTNTPVRTNTPIPPPPTEAPSSTPSATFTATASVTPGPSATFGPSPTFDPSASPTATGTAGPSATPTFGPSPTQGIVGTPNPFPFGGLTAFYLPNCALTQVKGTIRDSRTNAPVNGVTVRVWWDGVPFGQVYSLPSGSDPTRGAGEWDVVLDAFPKAGTWYVMVVDRATGGQLSDLKTVTTDTGPCQPGQSGRQVVIQDFIKYGEGPGIPGVTSTPTRVPSPSVPPTSTSTVTPTPTITPTPTQTPVSYYKDEEPDAPIPDGPNGEYESPVQVPDNVSVRLARVFVNITHDDTGDLDINLLHPDGTRIILHQQGQDAGGRSIRRWFDITGDALNAIRNKPTQGIWTLEVIDRVEDKLGTLSSWTLEIYP